MSSALKQFGDPHLQNAEPARFRVLPFILFSLSFAVAPLHAATIYVTGSITEAIRAANPGDTLVLCGPTVFHEHVVVDKRLRLQGTNSPTIDASGEGTVLTLSAPGAEVDGVHIRHGGSDLSNFDSGVMVTAPEVTVSNCSTETGGFGIYIRGVDNCQLVHNSIIGDTNLPAAKRGNGIHLWKTKRNLIANNSIRCTRDGAYFSYADNNLIVSNAIDHTRFGIHYMYSHHNKLRENVLTANAVGAALMFARDCVIERNLAFGNRRHGILLKQVESSIFRQNAVYGQNRGFFIQQAAQNRFEENLVAENDIGLYLSNGSEQNVFVGNGFVHNADQLWQPQDEVELGRLASNSFSEHGRGNFWSDYTGVDVNADGIGDTPYHETDLYGYIVDHHPEARVFAHSPAARLLRNGEKLMPLLTTEGVTDPYPLATIPPVAQKLLSSQPALQNIARR